MKLVFRVLILLALVLVPSFSAVAQSTPEPVADEMTPFAFGLNAPATFIDERGNAIYSISITGIEPNWQDHDEYDTPRVGMEWVQVQLEITNLTSRAANVSPYTISLLDSTGAVLNMGFIYDREDIWIDEITLPAGESVEGTMIFEIYPDVDPMTLLWQPEYSSYVIIYLGDQ